MPDGFCHHIVTMDTTDRSISVALIYELVILISISVVFKIQVIKYCIYIYDTASGVWVHNTQSLF